MQTHAWRRAKVATTAAATTAIASYLYLLNEDVVSKRAARLERLQKCADVQPRVAPDDKAAQLSMEAPIVVRGLLDSWPAMGDSARSWTWGNLRRRMGHSLVDAGTTENPARVHSECALSAPTCWATTVRWSRLFL